MNLEYLYFINWIIRFGVGALIVLRRRSSSSALAWLVVVLFIPIPGAVGYFLVGENRLGQKRTREHKAVVERLGRLLAKTLSTSHVVYSDLGPSHQLIASLAEGLGGREPVGGNDLILLNDVEPFVTRLVEDLDAARSHCHLLYFIFSHDKVGRQVAEALIRAARRGVTCRLLVDAAGSRPLMKSKLWGEMRQAGIKLGVALPVNPLRAFVARLDLRNHRKLAVIDGRVAYAGSHNISQALYYKKERFGAWVDASVRLTGATVQLLQELFIQDWYATTGEIPDDEDLFPRVMGPSSSNIPIQVVPTGPASEDAPLEKVILQAIHVAEEHVGLTTPYFVPDDALIDALRAAAWRGVEVDLVVPKLSDAPVVQAAGRSRYGELLEVGVRIYEYKEGLLHAKTVTVDHSFALIGSANLDIRSFMLNFEVALLVYDEDFASQVHFLRRSYVQHSDEVTLWAWRRRGPRKVLFDNISKLVSPLL